MYQYGDISLPHGIKLKQCIEELKRLVYEISVRLEVGLLLRNDRRPTNDRPHIWENFKLPYLRYGWSDPLHVWFYGGVFGVGGSNGVNSGLTKINRYVGENNARGVIRLVTI